MKVDDPSVLDVDDAVGPRVRPTPDVVDGDGSRFRLLEEVDELAHREVEDVVASDDEQVARKPFTVDELCERADDAQLVRFSGGLLDRERGLLV